MKKVWIWCWAFGLAGCVWAQGLPVADRIEMRDGSQLEGQFLAETRTGWQFRERDGSLHTVAPASVRLIHFADPGRARRFYGISARSATEHAEVMLLPTESFGRDLLEGLRGAEKSIHVLAYNLSNWGTAPMADIFETLKQKAQAGVEVRMVLEFGSGTSARLKNLVLEFAEYLAGFGVEVRYLQEHKIQHKKLVTVDGRTLWLGSANLTASAMAQNEEFNARTSARRAVDAASKDFQGLWNIARTAGDLDR